MNAVEKDIPKKEEKPKRSLKVGHISGNVQGTLSTQRFDPLFYGAEL